MLWIDEFKGFIINENPNIEGALRFKDNFLPKRLFQYRSVSTNKIKSLEDDNVWVASPLSLNDPYDIHMFIDPEKIRHKAEASIFQDLVPASEFQSIAQRIKGGEDYIEIFMDINDQQGLRSMNPIAVNQFRQIAQSIVESAVGGITNVYADMRAQMGVSSFSERVDCPLMWAHYTGSHKGYCVEYDFTSSNVAPSILPVIYQDEIFECSFLLGNVGREQLIITALVKSKDWEYEKEWRMVVPNVQSLKSARNVSVPTPKAVYLGSHIAEGDKAKIVGICEKKGVDVFQMIHSQREFKMIPKRI